MTSTKTKCAMIGCGRPAYRTLAIAPATVVELCAGPYAEEQADLESKKAA